MSQVSPGWYPDPSGRFAQRYHDGARWTEHVADAEGNRATDAPAGQAGSASYAGSAQPYGRGGQRSSDPYGQQSPGSDRGYGGQSARQQGYGDEAPGSDRGYGGQSARQQGYGDEAPGSGRGYGGQSARQQGYGGEAPGSGRGYGGQSARQQGYGGEAPGSDRRYGQRAARDQGRGQERPGPDRGYGQRPGERSWDQGAAAGSWQAQPGGPARRDDWPHAQGAEPQGRDGWAAAPVEGQAAGPDWRPADQGHGAAQYDAARSYGQPTAYGRPDYASARSARSPGFTPTIGLIVAAVGAVLLLLSLFGLDFLELSFPGLSRSISLGDIAGDFGEGAPAALATYADFGRFLAVLVIAFAILAVARVVPQLRDISALPAIVAVACGAFALWHVLAMLASGEEGVDVSPTFGAILGLAGYVALAAAPFLRKPIQAQR
jgi:hypothetical protein